MAVCCCAESAFSYPVTSLSVASLLVAVCCLAYADLGDTCRGEYTSTAESG